MPRKGKNTYKTARIFEYFDDGLPWDELKAKEAATPKVDVQPTVDIITT